MLAKKGKAIICLSVLCLAGLAAVSTELYAQPPHYRGRHHKVRPFPAPIPAPLPAPRHNAWRLFGLNNRLIETTELFLDRTARQRDCVPQGWRIARDAQDLLSSARDLRRSLQRGEGPSRVIRQFHELQRDCDRLTARVNRVADGGWGPNIALIHEIGRTCALMRHELG